MGEQKPEKVKKHICTGLLAHVSFSIPTDDPKSKFSAVFHMLARNGKDCPYATQEGDVDFLQQQAAGEGVVRAGARRSIPAGSCAFTSAIFVS